MYLIRVLMIINMYISCWIKFISLIDEFDFDQKMVSSNADYIFGNLYSRQPMLKYIKKKMNNLKITVKPRL